MDFHSIFLHQLDLDLLHFQDPFRPNNTFVYVQLVYRNQLQQSRVNSFIAEEQDKRFGFEVERGMEMR